MAYESMFENLRQLGVLDVILPFILVFTIVFAVLQKVKIFGSDPKTKSYNTVIALVLALAVVFPHVLWGTADETDGRLANGLADVVEIMNNSLPNVSVVVVAIVMGLLIIGVLGKRFEIGDSSLSGWIALAAFGLIVYIFGSAAHWWDTPVVLDFLYSNPDLVALVVTILVFAIIIWFITKEDDPKKDGLYKRVGDDFSKMLKGDK